MCSRHPSSFRVLFSCVCFHLVCLFLSRCFFFFGFPRYCITGIVMRLCCRPQLIPLPLSLTCITKIAGLLIRVYLYNCRKYVFSGIENGKKKNFKNLSIFHFHYISFYFPFLLPLLLRVFPLHPHLLSTVGVVEKNKMKNLSLGVVNYLYITI